MFCLPIAVSYEYRLVNGTTKYEGRFEVRRDGGPWGTINGKIWTPRHTAIACRTLGYASSTTAPIATSDFGIGTGPVHTTIRSCYGYEWELMDCEHASWDDGEAVTRNHCCDVGIVCIPGKSMLGSTHG